MARNSAKSKGYRKQQQKKPFLTKKELIAAIIIFVVFVAAFVCILDEDILFSIFPDGNLAARDVKDGDIVAYASNDKKTRYVKIGEIGELDGYTRTPTLNNQNVAYNYKFTPDDKTGNIEYVSVSGSAVEASTLPSSYRDTVSGLGATIEMTDTVEATIQNHKAYIFSYTNDYYDSEIDPDAAKDEETSEESTEETSEDKPSNTFQQNLSAYIDIDGTHTLCLHINCKYQDGDHYIPDDQVVDYVLSFTDCFTIIDPQTK